MNWIKSAVDQPITVAVGIVIIILSGLIVLREAPVQMTPSVDQTVIAVTTRWDNASPQEIETEVVDKQEEKLQGVINLRSMSSTSQLGQGQIRLEFNFGTDLNSALREVSDKLREVSDYPDNVYEPVVEATDPDSVDYIAWFGLRNVDANYDVRTAADFLEDRIKPSLERIPGMSEVNVVGGREEEAQIRYDPERLAQRGITATELLDALRLENRNISGGAVPQGKYDLRVRTVGRFSSSASILNTVIREDATGPVYVRDVAEVVETHQEPSGRVRTAGKDTLAMNFQREPGSNVIEVMAALKARMAEINAPDGLLAQFARQNNIQGAFEIVQLYDETDYVFQAIDIVQSNIVIGGILAIFVLLVFLRSLRSVGVIALAIPISVFGGLAMLIALGRSVNVVSLAGMAFAIGMVVDNAIVVLENIYRHLEMGKPPYRATIDATKEVGGAVLASTLTTMIVFLPILLIQDTAGQLFADIAVAIMASVGMSMLVSLTVIPSVGRLILRQKKAAVPPQAAANEADLGQADGKAAVSLTQRIANIPEVIRRGIYFLMNSWIRRIVITVIFLTATGLGIVVLTPPLDYLPSGNRNITFGAIITPPGYNLGKQEELMDRVEGTMRPFFEKGTALLDDSNFTDAMRNSIELPAIAANPMNPAEGTIVPPTLANYFLVSQRGTLFHGAISDDPRRAFDVATMFRHATRNEAVPDTFSFANQFPIFRLGGNSGSAINVDIVGQNEEEVRGAAGALFGRLMGRFGVQFLRPNPANFNLLSPELQVRPNALRAAEVGLTTNDIALAVASVSDGVLAGEYESNGKLIDLRVMSKDSWGSASVAPIAKTPIATPRGAVVDLEQVADISWADAPEQIRRVGRQRAVTIEVTAPSGTPLAEALDTISEEIESLRAVGAIPPTVSVEQAGSAGKLNDIKKALFGDGTFQGIFAGSMFFAGLAIYLLLCVLFQSWTYPLIIMVSVPLATVGGFIGLAIVHAVSVGDRYLPTQNLDVLTILGFVILAGVVVNNAILIIAQTLNILKGTAELTPEDAKDMTVHKAISVAVKSRIRPIVITTMTSVGGMLPLVVSPGAGSELYRGLGAVIVGGLTVSTIFTITLVPILLSMVMDLRTKFGGEESLIPKNFEMAG